MAEDAANDIEYLVQTHNSRTDDLGTIRHWDNLAVCFEGASVWVKGFVADQIHSIEVKSIPSIKRYYAARGKLFPLESVLPAGAMPSGLWTPIARALRVELPAFNHNFFGISEGMTPRLTPSGTVRDAAAMIVSLELLEPYMRTAPAIRLRSLRWAILDASDAFILGAPLLPLPGDVYWRRDDFFIPAGYDLELYLLHNSINRKINPDSVNWVVWHEHLPCFFIDKLDVQPLTISSFKNSLNDLRQFRRTNGR